MVIETKGIFGLLARLGPIKSPYPDYAARSDRVASVTHRWSGGAQTDVLQAFHWIPTCAVQIGTRTAPSGGGCFSFPFVRLTVAGTRAGKQPLPNYAWQTIDSQSPKNDS